MTSVTDDLVRLYSDSDALHLAALVRKGEVSPLELTETAIALIEAMDPKLNAVVIRTFDLARRMAAGKPGEGMFAGVPFLLKNIGSMWMDTPLTASLPYLKDYVCPSDSELARRIKASGVVLLGRTNVPENGWCIATEPTMYGPTRNPWNEGVTPGGSSGGAAAAVASRMVPLAEGSDGGGSIRVPASCCGLVGLKPSRGRITYGPQDVDVWFGGVYLLCLTRTVRDTAAYLDVTAGNIAGDPYTPPPPRTTWLAGLADRPRRLKIGYTLSTPWGPPFAPEVTDAVKDTLALLEGLGHAVEEHDLAVDLETAWKNYNKMNSVQTLLDFDALAGVVGRPVEKSELAPFNWAQLERARSLSAAEHGAAIRGMRRANQEIATELLPYDVFLTPTLTQLPRPPGYWDLNEPDFDTYNARWTDAAFMFAFNLSGLPAMSVPAAWTGADVPIGVQLVGRYGDEATILRLAAQMEEARPWIGRRPQICAGGA